MGFGNRRRFLQSAGLTALVGGCSNAQPDRNGVGSEVPVTVDADMSKLGFDSEIFDDGIYRHPVYRKGSGPIVIVLHELPGMDKAAVAFVDRMVQSGFNVYMPLLFGEPLKSELDLNYFRLCISKEFARLKANRSSPVCDWIRALANHLGQGRETRNIGVIGMCVTGAFAIPVIIDSKVKTAIISQPAIPISFMYYLTGEGEGSWMEELNISDTDLEKAADTAKRDDLHVMVQRFLDDRLCPQQRVCRIAKSFGEHAVVFEYERPRPDADKPHALLTVEYDKAPDNSDNPTRLALKTVVEFLHEQLGS